MGNLLNIYICLTLILLSGQLCSADQVKNLGDMLSRHFSQIPPIDKWFTGDSGGKLFDWKFGPEIPVEDQLIGAPSSSLDSNIGSDGGGETNNEIGENYELSVSNILEDLIRLGKEPVNWNNLLSVPFREVFELAGRYRKWFESYSEFRNEIIKFDRRKQQNDHMTASDLAMIERMKLNALKQFILNYVKLDELHHKCYTDENNRQFENGNGGRSQLCLSHETTKLIPANMINTDGGLNLDYLMQTNKIVNDNLGLHYLSELLSELIDTLECKLEEDKGTFQAITQINNISQSPVANDNASKHNNRLLMNELKSQTINVSDNLSDNHADEVDHAVEEAVACSLEISNTQLEEAMNRLRQVAQTELSSAISLEVVTLAQIYFMVSMGLSAQPDISVAYLGSLRFRLIRRLYQHLTDNLPVLTVIDNVYKQVKKNIITVCSPMVPKELLNNLLPQ